MLTKKRNNRKRRVRAKIKGVSDRPRLTVYRSNKFIYGQIIDDSKHTTLVSESGIKRSASEVGAKLAKKAKAKKITQVVFDRAGYKYHGVIKSLAQGARKEGLKF